MEEEKECWKSITKKRASKGMNADDNTGKVRKKWKSRRKQGKMAGVRGLGDNKLTVHTYRTECMHHCYNQIN